MDKVVVTALLVIGSVTAAVVVIMTIGPSIADGSQSVVEANREASVRIKTNIEIVAVASDLAGTQIDAWVKNVGATPIYGLEKSDVFVITSGSRFDSMTYAPSGANTWVEDPVDAAWNRADTLHMVITLPAANPLSAGTHMLRVATPTGVTAEKFFSR